MRQVDRDVLPLRVALERDRHATPCRKLRGNYRKQPSFTLLAVRLVLSGYVTPWEIGRLLKGNWVSLEAMNDEILQINLPKTVPTVRVPVAFFLGRYDRQVDSQLAADYFENLSAPAKRLVWFESSAHNMPFEEPDKFNAAVPEVLQDLGVLSRLDLDDCAHPQQASPGALQLRRRSALPRLPLTASA